MTRGGKPRRRRLLILALPMACAALLWPASSQAFVACSHSGKELTVNLTADDDSVSFQRFGSQIAVLTGSTLNEYDDYDYEDEDSPHILIPCSGGTPTVDNVDHVSVVQSPGADFGLVTLDPSAGPLGPGATTESDGTSEIEFTLTLPGRDSGALIGGTDASEVFQMGALPSGALGVNANATNSSDPEVEAIGAVGGFVVFGEGGSDVVSGLGGPGFVGPLRGTFDGGIGGPGNDLLIAGPVAGSELDGDEGKDKLVGSPRTDYIYGGPAKDRIIAGRGNDRISALDHGKDRVICGGGKRDNAIVDYRDHVKGCERGARVRSRGKHRPPRFTPLAALFG
jgi:RTX calcium-binding nonapeptide repeat (4 copies)